MRYSLALPFVLSFLAKSAAAQSNSDFLVDQPDAALGFNYAAFWPDKSARTKDDFKTDFENAQRLALSNGLKFASARLYTMIQHGTKTNPISAIEAAIDTNTTLLLGIWCSAGEAIVQDEITALQASMKNYGKNFTDLVVGLSVGSEDLYRDSPTGKANKSPVGAKSEDIVKYINLVRKAVKGTALQNIKLGHVDTSDIWADKAASGSVVEAIDWIGLDAYPYFEGTLENDISQGGNLFFNGFQKTLNSTGREKEVWITEAGWPTSGDNVRDAVPSVENAKKFWDQVACRVLGRVNTWWYLLEDKGAKPSFGITSGPGQAKPLYSLTCDNANISTNDTLAPFQQPKNSSNSTSATKKSEAAPQLLSQASTYGMAAVAGLAMVLFA